MNLAKEKKENQDTNRSEQYESMILTEEMINIFNDIENTASIKNALN